MDCVEFIARVTSTRKEYDDLLSGLDEAQMTCPRTCGEWSVKDVIAHVTWYERQMVAVIEQRALVGSDLWALDLEQRNAAIYAQNRDRPLAEILRESMTVHASLMASLLTLNDIDLLEASRFREMPGEWLPWEMIGSNTFEHYPDHTTDIRRAFPGRSADAA
jgi:uncharacterized protein (TIGR03083 family)